MDHYTTRDQISRLGWNKLEFVCLCITQMETNQLLVCVHALAKMENQKGLQKIKEETMCWIAGLGISTDKRNLRDQ